MKTINILKMTWGCQPVEMANERWELNQKNNNDWVFGIAFVSHQELVGARANASILLSDGTRFYFIGEVKQTKLVAFPDGTTGFYCEIESLRYYEGGRFTISAPTN